MSLPPDRIVRMLDEASDFAADTWRDALTAGHDPADPEQRTVAALQAMQPAIGELVTHIQDAGSDSAAAAKAVVTGVRRDTLETLTLLVLFSTYRAS